MTETREAKGLSCLGKSLIAVIALPILSVVVVVVWWFSRQAIAQGKLDERKAELVAEGLPYDEQSLQVFYSQNTHGELVNDWTALTTYIDSKAFLQSAQTMPVFGQGKDVPPADQSWPDETQTRDFLQQNQWVIDEVSRLESPGGAVRYPIDFIGNGTLLNNVQASRGLARLMRLRHDVARHDGDDRVATDSVLGTLTIARSLEGQPTLIGQLIRLAILGLALEQIRTGLDVDLYGADQLGELDAALSRRDGASDQLRLAMIGERAFMLINFSDQGSSGKAAPAGWGMNRPLDALATMDLFDALLLQIKDDIFKTNDKLSGLSAQWERDEAQAGWLRKIDTVMTSLSWPALDSVAAAFARTEMSIRLAKTAMAVRRFQFQKEKWPDSLSDLKQIRFDFAAAAPPGLKPFGFRRESPTEALVWGFPLVPTANLPAMRQTPDEPPIEIDIRDSESVYRIRVR